MGPYFIEFFYIVWEDLFMLKELESYLESILKELGYEETVAILPSSKRDLGWYQVNICMSLAKKYHQNPVELANLIKDKLDSRFTNVNIAGPGFINFSLDTNYLMSFLNNNKDDFQTLVPSLESKKVVIDFGGANAAKALHVGHMRSANIGEALRRLGKLVGYEMISDVHLGDLGRQSGMLLSEIKKRGEYLEYFDDSYQGEYRKVEYTPTDLGKMYVSANIAAKENEERMAEVREITAEIDKGNQRYLNLWKQLVAISSISIKKVYDELNCHFDLFEGELDAFKDIPKMLEKVNPYLYESEGAMVMDVKEENDTKEMPPLIVIKKDGATIYATRDLATIYSREERFNPDEIWYVVDNRQGLYFEQVFRAAYKAQLVKNCNLLHLGFGTINGTDGKPYKTRDGGVMELSSLIDLISQEIEKKMKDDIQTNREEIKNALTIATLKYADLMSFRATDYIFDPIKFSSFDGKTGPYLLYTIVRLKSILKKVEKKEYEIKKITHDEELDIYLKITELPNIIERSIRDKSLNYITDFLFDLASLFNKFYNTYHILTEKEIDIKESYLGLVTLVYNVMHNLLDVLAIKEVDQM